MNPENEGTTDSSSTTLCLVGTTGPYCALCDKGYTMNYKGNSDVSHTLVGAFVKAVCQTFGNNFGNFTCAHHGIRSVKQCT
jgi:hypothetical protein